MAVQPLHPQRLEQTGIPQAVITPGRQKGLNQLVLHFFVIEDVTNVLVFHGLEVQHIPGYQVEQNFRVPSLEKKSCDDPSPHKDHRHKGKVPGMDESLRKHDESRAHKYPNPHHGPP